VSSDFRCKSLRASEAATHCAWPEQSRMIRKVVLPSTRSRTIREAKPAVREIWEGSWRRSVWSRVPCKSSGLKSCWNRFAAVPSSFPAGGRTLACAVSQRSVLLYWGLLKSASGSGRPLRGVCPLRRVLFIQSFRAIDRQPSKAKGSRSGRLRN